MMKKYLIIAMDIGMSAPGIVYGKLIHELTKYCEISVLCPSISSKYGYSVDALCCRPYRRLRYGVERFLYRYLGNNIIDSIWARKNAKQIKRAKQIKKYDGIISFTSCNNYASLYLGRLLSKKEQCKWFIYSVDAIPTPTEWNHDVLLHKNVTRQLRKVLSTADAFFSANPIMLQYELDLFGLFKGNHGVVLTPHDDTVCNSASSHEGYNFLYTGNIYGPRKVDALVAAFALFSKRQPNSKLVFVGKFFASIDEKYQYLVNDGQIVIHGFVEDLSPYYEAADVLIDIAAVHSNDVFLSSKVVNYLPIKKPIVAISGDNSPVRVLLGNIPSILQCHHDVAEVFETLNGSLDYIYSDFSDRKEALHTFASSTVAEKFIYDIERM